MKIVRMNRPRYMYAAGMFIIGAFVTDFLYSYTYGSKIGNSPFNMVIELLALIYAVTAFIYNRKDKRSN